MRLSRCSLAVSLIAATWSCTGGLESATPASGVDSGVGSPDAGPAGFDELNIPRARGRFVTTTDLQRYVFAPGCAAENNECHSNEDFPDMHTEGNLWNLVNMRCNSGVGERTTVEDFCEALGDELRITQGSNTGYTARIGSIELMTDAEGLFVEYTIKLDTVIPLAEQDATFEIARGGTAMPALGGGAALTASAGSMEISITNADALTDPAQVIQGDENQNGAFGDGLGLIVKSGSARESYIVRRLFGAETERIRMPLNENADNPNELNRNLSADEMYALMSWINCMQPGDGVSSAIRYDCAANNENDGAW